MYAVSAKFTSKSTCVLKEKQLASVLKLFLVS